MLSVPHPKIQIRNPVKNKEKKQNVGESFCWFFHGFNCLPHLQLLHTSFKAKNVQVSE